MSNWALNRLCVGGTPDMINAFLDACNVDGKFCFAGIVPEPQYENPSDWYEWRFDNWGTKEDIDGDITLVKESPFSRVYTFNTAWAGPYEWLRAVAKKFPELKLHMYSADPSMDWHTECMCRNGKLYMYRDTFENNIDYWEKYDAVFQF